MPTWCGRYRRGPRLGATPCTCQSNPGPGGWGAILRFGTVERELSGGEAATTNNRMELSAVIEGLQALSRRSRVDIYSDSQYVLNGLREWLDQWKRRGWKTADRKPVKNEDLWRRLDELAGRHRIAWRWVKGHAGHPENERADALAREGMAPFLKRPRKEHES